MVNVDEFGFDVDSQRALGSRGLKVLERAGGGKTRDHFLAGYHAGDVEKLRVLLVSRPEVDPDSITSVINRADRDGDFAEVDASNRFKHPYLAEVLDSWRVGDRRFNVQAFHSGADLSRMRVFGERECVDLFRKAGIGLEYLHEDGGFLHCDVKPANLVVTDAGDPMWIDFQNMTPIGQSVLRKGATPYTHPVLLNAFVGQGDGMVSKRTDVYALTGTLYYALTGKDPFDRALVERDDGYDVNVNGQGFRVALLEDGERVEGIDQARHEKKVQGLLKNVPKRMRHLVWRGLNLHEDVALQDMGQFNDVLGSLGEGYRLRAARRSGARLVLPTVAAVALAGGVVTWLNFDSQVDPRPTISEVLGSERYKAFNLGNLSDEDRERLVRKFASPLVGVKERIVDADKRLREDGFFDVLERERRIQGVDERLASSLARACYLYGGKLSEGYAESGEERVGSIFVNPGKAYELLADKVGGHAALAGDPRKYGPETLMRAGITKLKHCLRPEESFPDTYARYFSTGRQMDAAQRDNGDVEIYLLSDGSDGYRKGLPKYQRDAVDAAIGLYLVSPDGKVNFEGVPEPHPMEVPLFGGEDSE